MSDSWLERGHGDGNSLASVRSVESPEIGFATSPGSGAWRSRSGRTVLAVMVAATVIGSVGTAYAIRETLFPSIGAPTSRSVWQNPVPVDEPAPVAVTSSTSTPSTTSTTTSTTVVSTTTSTTDDSKAPTISVAHSTNPDDSGGSRSVSDDSGNSGRGSDEAGSNDSGSGVDNSGSGSGADDSGGSDRSGSDDSVDIPED